MEKSIEKSSLFTPFTIFALIVFLAVVIVNFYFFYFKKDYDFVVEVTCDPLEEQCFLRDCDSGFCPPNELSSFKRYALSGADFQQCENEDCEAACESGLIQCEQWDCEESPEYGESCSIFTPLTEEATIE